MAKVLFINGPASGHVFPTLGLVEELIAEGEQIVYVSSEEYRDQLERLGAVFVAYDNFLKYEDPFQTKLFMSLLIKIVKSYTIMLPCIQDIVKEQTFDYFIHDSMYGCGNILFDWLNIPHISVCTSFVGSEGRLQVSNRNPAILKENMLLLKQFIAESEIVREQFHITKKLDISKVFFNEGFLNLVLTSAHFQPNHENWGEHYRFVGPCLTNRHFSLDAPISNKKRKTVYISMGTQFNEVKTLYELCFKALASFDGQAIVSVGNRIDISSLTNIPDNFTVVPFVDQLEVLQLTDVFITHGGMNSVNEALYYNVPLIVIPLAADQPIVGNRVAELGAGIMMNKDTLTALQLREAVDNILSDDFDHGPCKILGISMRSAGGQRKAMEEIRKFKEKYLASDSNT